MAETTIQSSSYQKLVRDITAIYESAQAEVRKTLNTVLTQAYWDIGRRIVEEEQAHALRAEYGTFLLQQLSEELTQQFGKGFSPSNLKGMRRFYLAYKKDRPSVLFSWSLYNLLSSVHEEANRIHLEKQITKNNWDTRDLREAIKKLKITEDSQQKSKTKKELLPIFQDSEIPTLTVTRGILHAASIHEVLIKKKTYTRALVDCGFTILRDITFRGRTDFKKNTIIHTIKRSKSYTAFPSNEARRGQYTYIAQVQRIIDGDTLLVKIDCGFETHTIQRLRLRDIDAPEIDTDQGKEAQRFVQKQLRNIPFIIIRTYRPDKYDRYLADVFYLPDATDPHHVCKEGIFLNQELLDNRLATILD